MNLQNALSTIMDLCETGMKENDYLIVANQLKLIYDNKKQGNRRIVKANRILNREELDAMRAASKVTFELTENEQTYIMESRLKQHYEHIELSICEEIDEVALLLRETTEEKRDAWTNVKQWRYSYSVNRENSLYEHKKLVRREKELRLRLKELRRELMVAKTG